MTNSPKRFCVVPDSNIWRESIMLRSAMGAALRYSVHVGRGFIGLPEVINTEIVKHVRKLATEAVDQIGRSRHNLLALIGNLPKFDVPSQVQIDGAIAARFADMEELFIRVPMTLSHARGALSRVNDELPPNGPNNQQFKDSLIWEALLQLGREYDVFFITKDKGFYSNRDAHLMAHQLRDDCERLGVNVRMFSTLPACVETLQQTVPQIDTTDLPARIAEQIREEIGDYVGNTGVTLLDFEEGHVTVFHTENHNVLAIQFRIAYAGQSIAQPNVEILEVEVKGEATLRVYENVIEDVSFRRITIPLITEQGELEARSHRFSRVRSMMRDTRYTIRLEAPMAKKP